MEIKREVFKNIICFERDKKRKKKRRKMNKKVRVL
jgi:hypothetical protein